MKFLAELFKAPERIILGKIFPNDKKNQIKDKNYYIDHGRG
jgi:hypothetical protein